MKHLFINYELALLAKEKGFQKNCFGLWITDNYGGTTEKPALISVGGHWGSGITSSMINSKYYAIKNSECPAPLYQQIVDFIRDKGIVISIYNNASGFLWNMAKTDGGTDIGWSEYGGPNESGVWDNYYEALTAAITEAFNLIK